MAVLQNGLKCTAHPAFSGTPLFYRFAPPTAGFRKAQLAP